MSKCKNFLVLAVLFHPLFKPTPKPLNKGSAKACKSFVASPGLDFISWLKPSPPSSLLLLLCAFAWIATVVKITTLICD
jgi:hypothetical protein